MFMGLSHALRSLQALSVGDAYGENELKIVPAGFGPGRPWTDDTAMAISVVRMLAEEGKIDQDKLALYFADRYHADPNRGYGRGTANLLYAIRLKPTEWRDLSTNWWGEKMGSKGNGSLMRVPPLGAFYSKLDANLVEQARLSAEVTHMHPEAIDAAIAGAVAAHLATHADWSWSKLLSHVPPGAVYQTIEKVSRMPNASHIEIAALVGCGKGVTALDTTAYCLWSAARALQGKDFAKSMEQITSVGGDTDTNCAIVAGIIGNVVPPPDDWIAATEKYN